MRQTVEMKRRTLRKGEASSPAARSPKSAPRPRSPPRQCQGRARRRPCPTSSLRNWRCPQDEPPSGDGLAARDQARRLPDAGPPRRRPRPLPDPERPRLVRPLRPPRRRVPLAYRAGKPFSTARSSSRTSAGFRVSPACRRHWRAVSAMRLSFSPSTSSTSTTTISGRCRWSSAKRSSPDCSPESSARMPCS